MSTTRDQQRLGGPHHRPCVVRHRDPLRLLHADIEPLTADNLAATCLATTCAAFRGIPTTSCVVLVGVTFTADEPGCTGAVAGVRAEPRSWQNPGRGDYPCRFFCVCADTNIPPETASARCGISRQIMICRICVVDRGCGLGRAPIHAQPNIDHTNNTKSALKSFAREWGRFAENFGWAFHPIAGAVEYRQPYQNGNAISSRSFV